MKRVLGLLLFLWQFANSFAQYSVDGTVYTYSVSASSGIQAVYIANGLNGVTISYTADNSKTVSWYSYKQSLADKTKVSTSLVNVTNNGSTSTYSITAPEDASGYLVEEDGVLKSTLWMIDYSKHLPELNTITAKASDDCSSKSVTLTIDKSDEITYYGINGTEYSLDMQYKLQYNKLTWNTASSAFISSSLTSDWQTVETSLVVDAPLEDTKFTLTGDEIADYLGISQSVSSEAYEEKFTESHIVSSQTSVDADNEVDSLGTDSLGGSAPAEITFNGYSNEPVASYYTWTIYKKTDLTNWIARYNDESISYTFNDAGDYIVYLVTTNSTSSCQDSASVEFSISESFLDLPNYFTPNASEGENDEYKVAYKSLVSFKATIFNRWGNKLYQWTDPSKGWDGKYNGKFVTPGVYFVVIEAKGSDGVKYKKARDINILTTP
jgi:gliding motility-associated-like protein